MLRVGLDGGNKTCILSMEGKDPIIIPTVFAPYYEYEGGLKSISGKQRKLTDCLDVEIELNYNNQSKSEKLGRYFVGSMARREAGRNSQIREIGKNKAGDNELLVCMLTTLACGVIESQGKYEGRLVEEIKMVTGLPYSQYKQDSDREIFAKRFLGSHKVIIRGQYNLEVDLKITDVEVDCEGAGALKRLIFDENGEYLYPEEQLIDRIILGVDVGEFTTEVIALTFIEDLESGEVYPEYRKALCTGIDRGIANAKQVIIDYIRDSHQTIVDRFEIDEVLKRKYRKGLIDLEDGSQCDIVPMFESSLSRLAHDLATIINNRIKSHGEMGKVWKILLFGGGPCTLDNRMGGMLCDAFKIIIGKENQAEENGRLHSEVLVSDRPELANAEGYLEEAKVVYDDEVEE